MNKDNWQERTELQLGKEVVSDLARKHVLVVGLGGVGAYAAEMICRAGVGEISIVDGDVVNSTNRNRQLIALSSTTGKSKAELMQQRLMDINPGLKLHVYPEYIKDGRMVEILKAAPYHYVVDAIDTLSPKIYLLFHCLSLGLNVVSSMGAGGKLDPSHIQVAGLFDSYNCRLAHYIRKNLRKLGIREGGKAVFSPEEVSKNAVKLTEGEVNKRSTVGTISYMPPAFGCFCASVVIRDLIAQNG